MMRVMFLQKKIFSLLPKKISCNSSLKYLGAVLQQIFNEHWHTVAFASRSLNESEQIYWQLEK